MDFSNKLPYTVYDEPTGDWTIEQLLLWCLLKSQHHINIKRDELIAALRNDFENGKQDVLDTQQEAVKILSDAESNELAVIYNNTYSQTVAEKKYGKTCAIYKNCDKPIYILIDIISGPHKRSQFKLQPRPRKPCFVGRSTGKKFRERGVSLPEDSEVSTTHGKFETKPGIGSGKFFFVDTCSTNGSLYEGKDLDPATPLHLEEGMQITVGKTTMKISFGY